MFAFSDKDWPGIAKMVEECGELTEVLPLVILLSAVGRLTQTQGKLMMIQGGTDHWSGDLRKAMVQEMADVRAAIEFVAEHNLSKRERKTITTRVQKKLQRFEKWHKGAQVQQRVARNQSKAKTRKRNA
jgi:tRNA U34 5-carboxymethylaminomethyl modifying GTPase MnmE/TrmE